MGWTIDDIWCIYPNICMYKILFEEEHKPSLEQLRRLNPIKKEVVKKEILNWVDVGIINPIFLMCDVSVYDIGVVLGQCLNKVLENLTQ